VIDSAASPEGVHVDRDAYDDLPDGVLVVDPSGVILVANPAAGRVSGAP
jgi:PAS domain-containing protein